MPDEITKTPFGVKVIAYLWGASASFTLLFTVIQMITTHTANIFYNIFYIIYLLVILFSSSSLIHMRRWAFYIFIAIFIILIVLCLVGLMVGIESGSAISPIIIVGLFFSLISLIYLLVIKDKFK